MYTSPTSIGFSVVAIGATFGAYFTGNRLSETNSYPTFNNASNDNENNVSIAISDTLDQSSTYEALRQENPLYDSMQSHQRFLNNYGLSDLIALDESQTQVGSTEQSKTVITKEVTNGDSFISLARAAGADSTEITNLLYRSGIDQKLFSLRKGQILEFTFVENELLNVAFLNGGLTYTILEVDDEGLYSKSEVTYPVTQTSKVFSFSLSTTLSQDALDNGLTAQEILSIENVLRHQVNFSRLPAGAIINAVYERNMANGRIVSSILKLVEVDVRSQSYVAARYKENGVVGYFNREGVSVLPSFTRHPIKNPIISSKFDLRRKHPILGTVRPHYGTDYAHMRGTPVLAISDAKIKYIGSQGGYGNLVILSHPAGVETLSAHLERFPKGLKVGDKVKKGDTVGYVGKTGLSTGYHLHFEMMIDGKKVDSLTAELPTVEKVKDATSFTKYVDDLFHRFK